MKLRLRTKLILCAFMSVLTVGALGAFTRAVHAADESDNQESHRIITLSPASQKTGELKPGDTKTGTFNVTNSGTEDIKYTVGAEPYKVKDESYEPIYGQEGTYTTISKWITFSKTSGTLKPGESDAINYTIKVPSDAPAGGQYAAIVITDDGNGDSDSDTSVTNTGRLAMIIYSRIAGNTVNCAKIHKNETSGFLLAPPITVTSLVENCGNVDVEAEYIFKVYPLFSDEEIYTNEDNPEKRTILPDTKRYNSLTWENSPAFGIFRVEQIVKIGDQEDTVSKLIVICPLWLIIIFILLIGAIVFWLVARHRGRKTAGATN